MNLYENEEEIEDWLVLNCHRFFKPTIFIDSQLIGGYEEVRHKFYNGELYDRLEMANIKGHKVEKVNKSWYGKAVRWSSKWLDEVNPWIW